MVAHVACGGCAAKRTRAVAIIGEGEPGRFGGRADRAAVASAQVATSISCMSSLGLTQAKYD